MGPDEFREVGHRLVDEIAELMRSLRQRPVGREEKPSDVRKLLPGELPQHGTDAAKLIEEFVPLFFDHSLFIGHPRFYGYITSSAAPIGALADLLAASVNPNVGAWKLSAR
jgi:glutamate/tyrosine decarboxylase-like PLP-dependent enzyme